MIAIKDFFPPEVCAVFSGRGLDFTSNDGQRGLTREQQQYFSARLGFSLPQVFNIRQVHGNNIVYLTRDSLDSLGLCSRADAVVTDLPLVPLCIRTADCLPVFIYDNKKKCLGLVHAGWKGSRVGIVVNTLEVLRKRWGCQPENLMVAFGPAIRNCCYEVGPEFEELFPRSLVKRDGRIYFDLALFNNQQLLSWGVPGANIYDAGECTCCDSSFYSYRRQGTDAGRHLSLLMLQG